MNFAYKYTPRNVLTLRLFYGWNGELLDSTRHDLKSLLPVFVSIHTFFGLEYIALMN